MAKLTRQQRKDNAERAERGNEALQQYKANGDRTSGCGDDDDLTALTDLLADLMHYAEAQRQDWDGPMDWDDALRMARMHFEAEQKGEQ